MTHISNTRKFTTDENGCFTKKDVVSFVDLRRGEGASVSYPGIQRGPYDLPGKVSYGIEVEKFPQTHLLLHIRFKRNSADGYMEPAGFVDKFYD